jgi:hypothetical protein
MNPTRPKIWLPAVLFLLLLFPSALSARQILFYYNGKDGNEIVLRCASILRDAGNKVTTVDVAGRSYDPTRDNWNSPYDQVWDMRFIDRDRERCGSGSPTAADYFDERWRAKATSYLNHCGRLFIAGEHYQMADRNEGLYQFLQDTQAVRPGYDSCAPSPRGNSTTEGRAFYPILSGLGPVSFYGAYVGGIPKVFLNGTSFVETKKDWRWEDGVNRSVVSGWSGDQLGGLIRAPLCAKGKLFIVWDATMWSLWDEDLQDEVDSVPPAWSESSWFSWDPEVQAAREKSRIVPRAQFFTRKFFPAIVQWLGAKGNCPCSPSEEDPVEVKVSPVKSPARFSRAPTPTLAPPPQWRVSQPDRSAPETIVFTAPPVNVYMRFLDGPGFYQLDVMDAGGNRLKTVFQKQVTREKEAWAAWDGAAEDGRLMPVGTYTAIFSKDGKVLRKIILTWIVPK